MLGKLTRALGRCLPTCYKALDLAERGCEQRLSLREKLSLRYNGRLCVHCNCARPRFEQALEKMHEAERKRSS